MWIVLWLISVLGQASESNFPNVRSSEELNISLVALYHFNELQGATSYLDSSFSGNDLSCLASNCPEAGVHGKTSTAARFDAANSDGLTASDNDNLDNTSTLTIQCWVYIENVGSQPRAIVSKRVSFNSNLAYSIFIQTSGELKSYVEGNDTHNWGTTLVNNRWYHLVLTFDGAQTSTQRVRMYVNGTEDSSSPHSESASSISNHSSALVMGTFNTGGTRFMTMILDELSIYNIVLNRWEVLRDYRRGLWRHRLEGWNCDGIQCEDSLWMQSLLFPIARHFQFYG